MNEMLSAYLTLAGPAILAALAVGAASYLLFGGRDMGMLIMAAGFGVIAAMIVALVLSFVGMTESYLPLGAGVIVAAIAGFALRTARAA